MPDESLWRCPKCRRRFANHVHTFRLAHPNDVDGTFVAWMREADAVGEQRHLS